MEVRSGYKQTDVGAIPADWQLRTLSELASLYQPQTISAKLFTESEIPWDELAFRTVRETLEHYFADRARGLFGTHAFDIE